MWMWADPELLPNSISCNDGLVVNRGPGYFEVDVDVGSSRAAATAVGLVSGATTSLVIDMAILLEGRTAEELPEQLLGTVRFSHLDMKGAPFFDPQTGIVCPAAKKSKK